jgi:outer membrane receptor protein involved in Fe transport
MHRAWGGWLLAVTMAAGAAQETRTLGDCFAEIGERTGARIVVQGDIALDRACARVPGGDDPARLLAAVLAGSGLSVRAAGQGLYVVVESRAADPAGSTPAVRPLDRLEIESDALDAEPRPRLAALDAVLAQTRYERDELAAKPFVDIAQLSRLAPNLYGTGARLAIRGVERDSDFLASNTVFIDGIDVGSRLLRSDLLPLEDLERIVIQRGPRASSDGSAVMGGKVELRTETPPPEPLVRVRTGIDDDGRSRSGLVLGGPIADIGLSGRIALDRREEEPDVRFRAVPAVDIDRVRRDTLLGKLWFEPESEFGWYAGLTAIAIDSEITDRLVGPFVIESAAGEDTRLKPQFVSDLPQARRLGVDAEALAITAGIAGDGPWQARIDLTRTRTDLAGALFETDLRVFPERERESRSRHRLELTRELAADWNLLLGAERFALDTRQQQDLLRATADAGTLLRDRRVETLFVDTESAAVMLERVWNDGDAAFAFGLRELNERVRYGGLLQRRLVPRACGQPDADCAGEPIAGRPDLAVGGEGEVSLGLPVAALRWRFDDVHAFVASHDAGYRSGGVVPGLLAETTTIAPERSATSQLGWQARWSENWDSSVMLFYQDWRDRQIAGGLGEPPVTNGGRSHAHGAEIEVRGRIAGDLRVRIGLGILDAQLDRFRPGDRYGDPLLSDLVQPKAPDRTALLGLQWAPEQGWYAGIDAYRASDALASVGTDPRLRIDSYSVVDARVGWRNRNWDVSLTGTNLLDAFYVEDLRADFFGGPDAPAVVSYVPGDTRRVLLRVTWTY